MRLEFVADERRRKGSAVWGTRVGRPLSVQALERKTTGTRAFGELFRRHYGRAVGFAQRVLVDRSTSEDVAQAALLRIYETSRGKSGQFSALVLTTTRNLALNELRRRGRRHAPRAGLDGVE